MNEFNKIEGNEIDKLLPTKEEIADVRNALLRSKFPVPDIDAEWAKLSDKIKDEESQEDEAFKENISKEEILEDENLDDESPSRVHLYIWSAVVAVAACLAYVFLLRTPAPELPENVAMVTAPQATTHVTLTNAHGEDENVDDSAVSFASEQSAKPVDGKLLSLSTPRGKDCHLVLPDGTKVWLNAESMLDFPSQFGNGKRVVRLKGEAYFEVTKDKKRPFVVKNDYFTTTVLGTVFNIRAYDKKDANVVLVSGSVAVSTGFLSDVKYIKPGEMAVCKGRNQWDIHPESTYPYTQRKEGYFYFDNMSLHKIMAEIGRWYNKTVVFENTDLMTMKLHFVAERKQSLSSIVDNLNQMDGLHVVLGKNEVIVE